MEETKNIFDPSRKPLVLISPLDWGLGHATRCIPIIHELVHQKFRVIIAANGGVLQLLKSEFPDQTFIPIPNYNIRYSSSKWGFLIKLLCQFPSVFLHIYQEYKWLKKTLQDYPVDIIISDNRPGLHSSKCYCIYVTHQLNFKGAFPIFNKIASLLHKKYILKFDACWVPDTPSGLAGELSRISSSSNNNYHHIGPLSRYHHTTTHRSYEIAMILSGPEPQRTIFEQILKNQALAIEKKIILVRGIPSAQKEPLLLKNITIVDHLPANELNEIVEGSKIVISRSGYTSVMDYARLNKRAVLVPTPGQPEQEYLARYLFQKRYFMTASQHNFSLQDIINTFDAFPFEPMNFSFETYKNYISQLRRKKEPPLQHKQ